MKIIIYTYTENFTLQLAIDLIPKGIEPIEASSKTDVLNILQTDPDTIMVITECTEIDFLQSLKQKKGNLHLFLLYHKDFASKQLMELMKIGVAALIQYTENVLKVADDIIQNIIRNNIRIDERRKHLRVTPSSYEVLTASIYIKTLNRFVISKLVDISAGGVAVQLVDSIEASMLEVNQVYDPLILHIRGMEIKTIARLVGRRTNMAGFKFENVEEKEMHKISTYIHMRVDENARKLLKGLMQAGDSAIVQ